MHERVETKISAAEMKEVVPRSKDGIFPVSSKIRFDMVDAGCSDPDALDFMERAFFRIGRSDCELDRRVLEVILNSSLDLASIKQEIMRAYGLSTKVSSAAALNLGFRARQQKAIARSEGLGITTGTWRTIDKFPPCGHRNLDKKKFKLDTGMLFQGTFILPGETPGCKCIYETVIPGWDNSSRAEQNQKHVIRGARAEKRSVFERMLRWIRCL